MTSITISIPIPPKVLHPNRNRVHWGARSRATRTAKDCSQLMALVELGKREAPRWTRATGDAHFNFHVKNHPKARKRSHDADNLAAWLKSSWDGIAAAGVLENDRGLSPRTPTYGYDPDKPEGVTLTVTACGSGGSK